MLRVSSAEFLKDHGTLTDQALTEPVAITRSGRVIEDLSETEVEAIANARVPAEHDHLNALLDG